MAVIRHELEIDGSVREEASTPGARGTCSVLIGFAEALAAPETAWSLLDAGFRVYAFTRRGTRPPLRRLKGIRVFEIAPPEVDARAAGADLASILRASGAGAVMPLDDFSLWLCGSHVLDDVMLVGPRGEQAAFALDKRLQIDLATKAGLTTPVTAYLQGCEEALSLRDFPLVLKPALAVSQADGKLVRDPSFLCGSRRDVEKAVRALGASRPILAQPFLRGVGEGIFGLRGSGGLKAISGHRRIRMMNPRGSGSSACRSVQVANGLIRPVERMLEMVDWRGMFMAEFLRDEQGRFWFMEVNGRPWGSMALARRSGFEYPAWALLDVLGEDWETPTVSRDGRPIVCRHLGRELVHLLMVLRGSNSSGSVPWPSRRRALMEVLSFRRDDCWYNWRPGSGMLFLEDTVKTVFGQLSSAGRRS